MVDVRDNPIGLDGFEFIEFTGLDHDDMAQKFTQLGFTRVAKHNQGEVALYRQGDISFTLNLTSHGYATEFAKLHGPSACAMGFRVKSAKVAYELALKRGAEPYTQQYLYQVPAIKGIGDSVIYFIETTNSHFYQDHFDYDLANDSTHTGAGLTYIDHLTHNVYQGQMDKWCDFYQTIFNFREIRHFDIKGQMTGLVSRAMTSPCNKIRIPINESTDAQSQIEEFLHDFHGEGIQHIALGSDDIYASVEQLRQQGINFMDVPDTYYEAVEQRLSQHGEDLTRMHDNRILIDGTTAKQPKELLLQIFTQNMFGPVFLEIIQRKGDEGFGEGNFQALFESIELDQIRRGVLKKDD